MLLRAKGPTIYIAQAFRLGFWELNPSRKTFDHTKTYLLHSSACSHNFLALPLLRNPTVAFSLACSDLGSVQ